MGTLGLIFTLSTLLTALPPGIDPAEVERAKVLSFKLGHCYSSLQPDIYQIFLDTDGDEGDAELVTYGSVQGGRTLPPVAWLFYKKGGGEPYKVVLTLPGHPTRTITFTQLQVEYPHPCTLLSPGV